jgi:hypothetical protein
VHTRTPLKEAHQKASAESWPDRIDLLKKYGKSALQTRKKMARTGHGDQTDGRSRRTISKRADERTRTAYSCSSYECAVSGCWALQGLADPA